MKHYKKDNRASLVSVRVTEAEREKVESLAEQSHHSISSFLRALIAKAKVADDIADVVIGARRGK